MDTIKQYAEDRRYEKEVLYPQAEYKVKLMFCDDKNGICIPPDSYLKLTSKPFTVWDAENSLYFSDDEKANEKNKRKYIENRMQMITQNRDLTVPLIYEEE